jgi:hypothetical protein
MEKLDTFVREDKSCRIRGRESHAEFRIANNQAARQSAAAGAFRHFTASCSVTCEASLYMATVTSQGPTTDTGLGFYYTEPPSLHIYFGIITSVKEKEVFRTILVLIPIVKLILIRMKYKSEEMGREENNKNIGKTRKSKNRKMGRLMPSYLSSKCQGQ